MQTFAELLGTMPENLTAETREQLRRLTAPARHDWRVREAIRAAESYGSTRIGGIFLCFAEAGGLYGGGVQNPGAGTRRHPAFRHLGKGRRNASDGDAWTAAIAEAGYRLAVEMGFSVDSANCWQCGSAGVYFQADAANGDGRSILYTALYAAYPATTLHEELARQGLILRLLREQPERLNCVAGADWARALDCANRAVELALGSEVL